MAFQHNSEIDPNEPSWGSVDKTKLPRVAFADQGEPDKKSTWGYPHHHIKGGGNEDENGIYTTGRMFLNKGGLGAAWSAAQGGRSGQKASQTVIDHLQQHRKATGADTSAQTDAVIVDAQTRRACFERLRAGALRRKQP